jgi:hypothetical protein
MRSTVSNDIKQNTIGSFAHLHCIILLNVIMVIVTLTNVTTIEIVVLEGECIYACRMIKMAKK